MKLKGYGRNFMLYLVMKHYIKFISLFLHPGGGNYSFLAGFYHLR